MPANKSKIMKNRIMTTQLKAALAIFALLLSLSFLQNAGATAMPVLYGATTAGDGSSDLYILSPVDGSVIQDVGAIGFSVTGLAFDPITGVLYGSTGNNSQSPGSLITIDTSTGAGTLVGSYGPGGTNEVLNTMADLTFTSNGALYGWAEPDLDSLYSINTTTGTATLVGPSGLSTGGSGLGANSSDVIYFTGDTSTGELRTIDPTTGMPTDVVVMSGVREDQINSLAFDPTDVLYGVLRGGSSGEVEGFAFPYELITIDTQTGLITSLGPTVDRLDAIAFAPSITASVPTGGNAGLLFGIGLVAILFVRRPCAARASVTS